MRICYFGLLSEASSRHSMHPPGLRAAGDEVIEWTAPLWLLPGHSRGGAPGGISAERVVYELGELGRTILRIAWLTVAGLRIHGPIDAVVVSEFNHALTPLARAFARRWGARLVVDFCFSFYDTAVNDRRALYPEILKRAGLRLDERLERHVNRRTGRRAGEYFESILICR